MARRILLADDSVTAQNMGRRILSDAGYEVVTVNNGSAALKKIAENNPDLIVLDVYMPGYGGLEVCQRVKENPETKRIPVLLTVGKLEPFKPEEARRVGADAFIIKPFEATELLTVLTKLEDKIVAQPQGQKSGRFAKTLAAVESSDKGDRFGDRETGWKNRLTIPSVQAKPAPEVEAVEVFGQAAPASANLPADITAEEIAAITAAASAFGDEGVDSRAGEDAVVSPATGSPEAASAQSGETQAPATLPSIPQAIQELPAEAFIQDVATSAAEGDVPGSTDAYADVGQSGDQVSGLESPPANLEAASTEINPESHSEIKSPVHSEPQSLEYQNHESQNHESRSSELQDPEIDISKAVQPAAGDAEVLAAIASLAPTGGYAIEGAQPGLGGTNGSGGAGREIPAGLSREVALAAESGPRWIAEPVALAAEEAKLALHQEMEQAGAARAAAEIESLSAVAAVATETSNAFEANQGTESAIAAAVTGTGHVSEASSVVSSGVASSSGVSPSGESPSVDSLSIDSLSIDSTSVDSPGAHGHEAAAGVESAYAAAASVGSVADHASATEAVSATTAALQSSATVEGIPQREAELAAAWQNWKQIRETFVGSEPSAAGEEAPAETSFHHDETAVSAQPESREAVAGAVETEEAADGAEESSSIASIVDSMLAELRPKLVEEIAKKMKSEKKEKDKKRR